MRFFDLERNAGLSVIALGGMETWRKLRLAGLLAVFVLPAACVVPPLEVPEELAEVPSPTSASDADADADALWSRMDREAHACHRVIQEDRRALLQVRHKWSWVPWVSSSFDEGDKLLMLLDDWVGRLAHRGKDRDRVGPTRRRLLALRLLRCGALLGTLGFEQELGIPPDTVGARAANAARSLQTEIDRVCHLDAGPEVGELIVRAAQIVRHRNGDAFTHYLHCRASELLLRAETLRVDLDSLEQKMGIAPKKRLSTMFPVFLTIAKKAFLPPRAK